MAGGFKIAEAFVELNAKGMSGVKGDLDKVHGATSSLTSFVAGASTAAFMKLGDVASAALSSLAGILKQSVLDFADAERIAMRLETTLRAVGGGAGWSAEQLGIMQEQLQSVTRFDDEAVASAESLLLTFSNIRGDIFKEALKSAADLASFMEGDLPGAARMLGRALQDPERAFQLLRRAGVAFSESEKEALQSALDLNDTLGAQEAILAAVNNHFGGQAAAEVETLSGQWAQLTNAMQNASETLGSALAPEMQGLMSMLRDSTGLLETFALGWIGLRTQVLATMATIYRGLEAVGLADAGSAQNLTNAAIESAMQIVNQTMPGDDLGEPNPEALPARGTKGSGKSPGKSADERAASRRFRQSLRDKGVTSEGLDQLAADTFEGGLLGFAKTYRDLIDQATKMKEQERERDADERRKAAVAAREQKDASMPVPADTPAIEPDRLGTGSFMGVSDFARYIQQGVSDNEIPKQQLAVAEKQDVKLGQIVEGIKGIGGGARVARGNA